MNYDVSQIYDLLLITPIGGVVTYAELSKLVRMDEGECKDLIQKAVRRARRVDRVRYRKTYGGLVRLEDRE